MGLLDFFKKDKRKQNGANLGEIENDKAQIARLNNSIRKQRIEYLRKKLERMKQLQEEQLLSQEIEDLETDVYGEEEQEEEPPEIDPREYVEAVQNDPETLFTNLLMTAFSKRGNPKGSSAPPPNPQQKREYSDAEIKSIIDNTGATIINQIKHLDDEKLKNIFISRYPDASDTSIQKAIMLIRA